MRRCGASDASRVNPLISVSSNRGGAVVTGSMVDRLLVTILGIDHVQVAAPAGGEVQARAFYGGLLGLEELPKPEPLRARGGCWFRAGTHDDYDLRLCYVRPAAQVRALQDAGFQLVRVFSLDSGAELRGEEICLAPDRWLYYLAS